MATDTGFNSLHAFVHVRGSYCSISTAESMRSVHLCFGRLPRKEAFCTVFDPPQQHERDATEPHIWLNVYFADSLPSDPSKIIREQPEQTVSWPKHGHGVMFTWSLSPCGFARCNPVRFITCHGTIPMPTS